MWTVQPEINARLMGVMYSNALLLVVFGAFQRDWARVRIIMVVVALFSIFATLLTFVYLEPFLAHPWFHLVYWLTMYFILFVAAPYVFYTHEKRYGGKLSVDVPLNTLGCVVLIASLLISLVCSLGFLFRIDLVNSVWPWEMSPLVGGLIGVLFATHFFAYLWALWDGDWLRDRPMFWQAPITGTLLMLLPLLHPDDLNPAGSLLLFWGIGGAVVLAHTAIIWMYRNAKAAEVT